MRTAIDAQLLSRPGTPWPDSLIWLYDARSSTARRRYLAWALALLAGAELSAGVLDFIGAPALVARPLAARMVIVALCLTGAAALLRQRTRREILAFGTPLLAQVMLSAWHPEAATGRLMDRNIVVSLILLAGLCTVPPLPARAARQLAATLFACFTAVLWFSEGTSQIAHHAGALAVGAAALGTGVALAVSRETQRRRDFLHRLNTEHTAVELRHANAELERLMNTDVLTGVANRRRFETDMNAIWRAFAQANDAGLGIGLILIDVDHFKMFNDTAGHAEGDVCLRAVAAAISDVVRDGAAGIARWGGEEFVVLAASIPQRNLAGLAERVRAAVAALALPHPALPGTSVTISVGAAWCGEECPCGTPDDLLRHADHALYAAKQAGRNRVVVHAAAPRVQALQ